MEKPRQRLINLVHGGDGKVAPWIEKATLRTPGKEDAAVYAVHIPGARNDGSDLVLTGSDGGLQVCLDVLHFLDTGDQPRGTETTPEEQARALEEELARLPQPEDCGRVIASLAELDK